MMLVDLHIPERYEGFLFLAEAQRNPPTLPPHRHVELELNVVVSGEISYVVDNQYRTFQAGTLLWFFPSQTHHLVNRSSDAQYYVAVFKPDMIRQTCQHAAYGLLAESFPPEPGVAHGRLSLKSLAFLREQMERMTVDGIDTDLLNKEAGFGLSPGFTYEHGDPVLLNTGLRYLLIHAWRMQLESAFAEDETHLHPSVLKALTLLQKDDSPKDLDALSALCGASPSHLSRIFRKQMGMPLTAYRNSVRLRKFWTTYERLGSGMLMQAVYEAGFGSYAQFYRVYKERYGKGPRESMK